jgi:chromosome segregation ATPase
MLENMEIILFEEKELSKKYKEQLEGKETEILGIKKDVEKLKEIYENKIDLLQTKMGSDKGRIHDIKNELKTKHNQIKDLTQLNQDCKSQLKTLKTQLEMKNEEISNYKKEFEKLFNLKEKKINDLQNVISQSYLSYNNGLNNIKIANKLDDEIKGLMKKLKLDEKDGYGENITYESLNESGKKEESDFPKQIKKNR